MGAAATRAHVRPWFCHACTCEGSCVMSAHSIAVGGVSCLLAAHSSINQLSAWHGRHVRSTVEQAWRRQGTACAPLDGGDASKQAGFTDRSCLGATASEHPAHCPCRPRSWQHTRTTATKGIASRQAPVHPDGWLAPLCVPVLGVEQARQCWAWSKHGRLQGRPGHEPKQRGMASQGRHTAAPIGTAGHHHA